MKHPKKRFVSALLAVAMVITCFLSFGGVSAAAFPPDYADYPIYYFYDCYPIVKEMELATSLSLSSAYLDGQNVTEDEFYDLIDAGYFTIVEPDSVFIIDIKTFEPDLDLLIPLFQNARSRGCVTVLAATYTEAEVTASSLNNYLDMYFQTSLDKMEEFVKKSLEDFQSTNNDLTGTCFLIDGNMVELATPTTATSSLCESSPFLRLLLLKLGRELLTDMVIPDVNDNVTASMYNQIVQKLYQEHNISILVHRTNNRYRELHSTQSVTLSAATDVQTQMAPSGTRLCAFGFWQLTTHFYNFVNLGQSTLGADNLPVYVFEIDPIEYGDSGLIITTASDLFASEERDAFMAALVELREILP